MPESRNVSVNEAAQVALGFLNRVQLSGQEVDAFSVARQLLQAVVSGELVIVQKPADPPPPGEQSPAPATPKDAEPLRRVGT
jgi:hypothetical protein